jgi:hypothetical protein
MDFKQQKEKAEELLNQFEERHAETLSDVYWITQDESDIQGDYCEDCIGKAVKSARKERKEAKKKILEKYAQPERIGQFGLEECKKAQKRELQDLGSDNFDFTYCYGGGYEAEHFLDCEICHKPLLVSILPNEQLIEELLEYIERYGIDDQKGYEAYWIIYNCWEEVDERHKEVVELTKKLVQKVIEILEPK